MSDSNKLTDAQVKFIAERMSEHLSEGAAPESSVGRTELNNEPDSTTVESEFDPVTGTWAENVAKSDIEDHEDLGNENILDMDNADFDFNSVVVPDEVALESLSKTHDLSDEDSMVMLEILKDYRNNKDDISLSILFNRFPEKIKAFINGQCIANGITNKGTKNALTKEVLETMIRDSAIDQSIIDFNQSMDKIFKEQGPEIANLYTDMTIKRVQNLRDLANKVRNSESDKMTDEQKEEKAQKLETIASNCEQSYILEDFTSWIENGGFKFKKYHLEKPEKVYREMHIKYSKSRFEINDIAAVPHILSRHVDKDIETDKLVKFALAFCQYTSHMKADDPADHAFMYYTIKNIISLDLLSEDDVFKRELVSRIEKILNIIK